MPAVVARSRAVYSRSNFGSFARECEAAASRTAALTAKEGAKTSKRLAPSGSKPDKRPEHRVKLKKSIDWQMTGKARAEWFSTSGHALHVEYGTSAHWMVGKMGFEWDNAGRLFYWNNPQYNNWTEERGAIIWHPGAKAQPFLRPAYAVVVQGKMMKIAKEQFPG